MSTKLVEQGFRAGNLVRVRSPGEVLRTLDADGTLDGLPFMPEMGEFLWKAIPCSAKGGKDVLRDAPDSDGRIREKRRGSS